MFPRSSGVLLPIPCLPSTFGIGDLGPYSYRLADCLHSAGLRVWHILPLNPTTSAYQYSPYHGASTFACNPLLVSPELLADEGLLDRDTTWNRWPYEIQQRRPEVLTRLRAELGGVLEDIKIAQYFFYQQWNRLRRYFRERSIRIFGDLPIYVPFDSADVWVHPHLLKLDETGTPLAVSGVPPDYFSLSKTVS